MTLRLDSGTDSGAPCLNPFEVTSCTIQCPGCCGSGSSTTPSLSLRVTNPAVDGACCLCLGSVKVCDRVLMPIMLTDAHQFPSVNSPCSRTRAPVYGWTSKLARHTGTKSTVAASSQSCNIGLLSAMYMQVTVCAQRRRRCRNAEL
jgi:hypothetical protein